MGNVNGREDGGDDSDSSNPSGVEDGGGSGVDDMAELYPSQVRGQTRGDGELMGQSPPPSPRAAQSPLMFAPQVPVLPLQRPDEIHIPSNSWMQTSPRYEEVEIEQGIPTMITWSQEANEVAVEGSWDDWKSRKPLQRSGKDFTLMKVLPSGVYHYRFIVDGQRRHAPDVPGAVDENGLHYNILDLQDYVPEDVGSISGFEPPQSPESTYNNYQLSSEDYSKEPPFVPPHLQMTLLNVPSSYMEIPPPLSRPQHVVLNHLYMQKGRNSSSQVALGSTHRFLAKYVTVVLYKPIQR